MLNLNLVVEASKTNLVKDFQKAINARNHSKIQDMVLANRRLNKRDLVEALQISLGIVIHLSEI